MEEWRTSQNTSVRPPYLEVKNRNCDLPSKNSSGMGFKKICFSVRIPVDWLRLKNSIKAKMMYV
jgi:hypothetical protein